MVDLKKCENRIEIKNSGSMPIVLFICGFLTVIFFIVIFSGISTGDPIGVVEVIFFVAFCAFFLGIAYSDSKKILTVSDNGVTFKSALKSDYISWADIKDWGISYHSRSKYGCYYYLYFSIESQNEKNMYSKKFKGKMIKFLFNGNEYKTIIDNLIPYCAEKTTIAPFIGKEK